MRRLFIFTLFLLLHFALPAAADDALYPPLSDPIDRYMQQLAIMSQQDEAIGQFPYNRGNIERRGCAPLSIANPLIAAFGVTGNETAAGLVWEITAVLTPNRQYPSKPIAVERIARVLNQARRAETAEDFPLLSFYVGQYPGRIHVANGDITEADIRTLIAQNAETPLLLAGRMYVQDSWLETVRVVYALYEAGYEDAFVFLGYAGAGTASTGAPLRSGEYGHYLAAAIHIGTFVSNGALYILDSLPRALDGEPCGPQSIYHVPYRFTEDGGAFHLTFTASRISPTVVKLSLRSAKLRRLTDLQQQAFPSLQARHEALIALHAEQLAPLKLYGRCVMMIVLN